jgi:N-ethylmaleimide reductase
MTADRGNRLIDAGLADLVAFGRPYVANPDLVERLETGAPLAEIDWETRLCGSDAGIFKLSALPGGCDGDRSIPWA